MPRYVRVGNPCGSYFFTVITYGRRQLFSLKENINSLINGIKQIQYQYPFSLEALVLLPDHLHALWTLPEGDVDYGKRWGLIKARFSKEIQKGLPQEEVINPSRIKRRETTVWQRRFWEHAIRDEEDFQKHLDYIHYNPMKHGLVQRLRTGPIPPSTALLNRVFIQTIGAKGYCFTKMIYLVSNIKEMVRSAHPTFSGDDFGE